MKTMVIRTALLASAFLFCVNVDKASGQQLPNAQSSSNSQPSFRVQQQNQQTQPNASGTQQSDANRNGSASDRAPVAPWKITSRIHVEKGVDKGYLVVQIDLADGYHVYSLNPKGSPSPTKLAVLPTNNLRVQSKFMADKDPKVIEKDPVFEQRIEKHTGQVQFFAPIILRPGIDLKKLEQEVQFSGQICSESACQPIRNHKVNAVFSGYFVAPKARSAAETQQLK